MDDKEKLEFITELVETILEQPELATSSDKELYFFAEDIKAAIDA